MLVPLARDARAGSWPGRGARVLVCCFLRCRAARAVSVSPPCHWACRRAGGRGGCVTFGSVRGRGRGQCVQLLGCDPARARATAGMGMGHGEREAATDRWRGRARGPSLVRSSIGARGLVCLSRSACCPAVTDGSIEKLSFLLFGRARGVIRLLDAHRRVGFQPSRRYFPTGLSRVTRKPVA